MKIRGLVFRGVGRLYMSEPKAPVQKEKPEIPGGEAFAGVELAFIEMPKPAAKEAHREETAKG